MDNRCRAENEERVFKWNVRHIFLTCISYFQFVRGDRNVRLGLLLLIFTDFIMA